MPQKVEILIEIAAKLKELDDSIKGMRTLNTESAATGVSLGRLQGIAGAALAGLGIGKWITEGVQFNATLESAALGIAAVAKQANPEKFKTFDDALAASAATIDLLKQKAAESPATFEQLVQGLQGISGAASAAGVSMKKQVDLVVIMSQTLAGMGIRSDQILQESRALLTGNINADAAAAKMLGITNEDIAKATQAGQLFEFLTGKMDAYAEAGKRGQNTFATALSNLEDATTQLKAKVSEPIFAVLSAEILNINAALKDPQIASGMAGMAQTLATLTGMLLQLVQVLIRNSSLLATLGKMAGTAAVGLGTFVAVQKTVQFTMWIAGWVASAAGIRAHTGALVADTVATNANASAKARGRFGGAVGAASIGLAIGASIYAEAKQQEAAAEALLRTVESRGNAETRAFLSLRAQVKEARDLKDQAELKKEIQTKLTALEEESAASTGEMRKSLEISAGYLRTLLGQFDELAGTAKEVALSAKEEAAQRATLGRTLGKELDLVTAKANGQTELVQRAEDEKRVLELVNGALKEGVKSRAAAETIARQIVAVERESLGLAEARRLADQKQSTEYVNASTARKLELKRNELATLDSRKHGDTQRRSTSRASRVEPLLTGGDAAVGSNALVPDLGLPPLPDNEPIVEVNGNTGADPMLTPDLPPRTKSSQKADGDYSAERAKVRKEIAELEAQMSKERAESEKSITNFKERQLTAEQNGLDPLKETTTEVERQQAVRKKVAELTEANEAIQEGQKKTQAEILTLATQEVANEELATRLQKEKSAGLKDDKRTLTQLKEEYRQIVQLIADINGSRLIPSGQKKGLLDPQRDALERNLAAQGAQGEDTRGELDNVRRDRKRSDEEGSFGGQFQGKFNSFADSLGTAGENAADVLTTTLGGALDGLNEGIYALVTGTEKFGNVWLKVGQGVLKEIIGITTKTILHYAIVTPLQTAFHTLGETQKATHPMAHRQSRSR